MNNYTALAAEAGVWRAGMCRPMWNQECDRSLAWLVPLSIASHAALHFSCSVSSFQMLMVLWISGVRGVREYPSNPYPWASCARCSEHSPALLIFSPPRSQNCTFHIFVLSVLILTVLLMVLSNLSKHATESETNSISWGCRLDQIIHFSNCK